MTEQPAPPIETLQTPSTGTTAGRGLVVYLSVLMATGVLYVATAAPGVLWQDSGMAHLRVVLRDIDGDLGLALAHPLYYLLGFAVDALPFGDTAWKLNYMSAVFGAVTVANVALLLYWWVGVRAAVAGAITLAVAHTFWWLSCVAEIYTLATALMTGVLLGVGRYEQTRSSWWLVAAFFVSGLDVANHMFGALTLACVAGYVLWRLLHRQLSWSVVPLCILAWLVGCSPYLYLMVQSLTDGNSLSEVVHSALFGSSYSDQVLNASLNGRLLVRSTLTLGMNCPTPAALLAIVGIVVACRTTHAFIRLLVALLAVHMIFAIRYTVPDQYTFFMPSLVMLSIMLGFGVHWLLTFARNGRHGITALPYDDTADRRVPDPADMTRRQHTPGMRRWVFPLVLVGCCLPVPVYTAYPTIARLVEERTRFSLGFSRQIPFRNEYDYFMLPWKCGYDGPQRLADYVFEHAAANSLVITDSTGVRPLQYGQIVHNRRRDLMVYPDLEGRIDTFDRQWLDGYLHDGNTAYVVGDPADYPIAWVRDNYTFADPDDQRVLWQITGTAGSGRETVVYASKGTHPRVEPIYSKAVTPPGTAGPSPKRKRREKHSSECAQSPPPCKGGD